MFFVIADTSTLLRSALTLKYLNLYKHCNMKLATAFSFLLISITTQAQKVELSTAKFMTGDNITYSYPATDDQAWTSIKTNQTWERQGHENYDGFAWYRFHLIIPVAFKTNSYWKDSVRIFLSRVDDAFELFLNGVKIGKSGAFPDDSQGYVTTWNKRQEFHIAANHPNLNWGGENILSVRVYDGGGPGGIFDGTAYVSMIDLVDGLVINNDASVQYLSAGKAKKSISLTDTFKVKISGTLNYTIVDVDNKKNEKHAVPVNIMPGKKIDIPIPITLAERTNIVYEFEESNTHKTNTLTEVIPYILTPAPPATARINGARVYGVRPNSPFLFKIAATGKKPLQYSVENLPAGLQVNATNGVISGSLKEKADYKMQLVVKNSLGTAKRELTVKCGDLLALTPPMGWNSWNCWGLSVSDEKLQSSAKAMMDKGLIDHGWSFMNIDDGWEADARNAQGEIAANKKFPSMKKTGDWLHSKGLKFGIYSSPGPKTCGGYLGSYQHELQDATTYANWGIDYLKYDWCSYDKIHDPKDSSDESYKAPYKLMQAALEKQPRDIVYSLCQYGMKDVWKWGATVNGNCWRTTGDIEDSWESMSNIGFSQTEQQNFAMPGRWNDPDMMVVGQLGWGDHLHPTRLTPDEQYAHVSLWCMLSAPLLIGCDLSKLDNFTLNLLTNDEVIAIDQDPLAKQAQQTLKADTYQVWMKELEDGTRALAIFNTSDKEQVVRFYWNNLGLTDNHQVRDLWRQKDLGKFYSMFATRLPPHGVTLIKITRI